MADPNTIFTSNIIAAILGAAVGAVLTASGKWLLDRRREKFEAERKKQAETKVENFLWGVFCSLNAHSERDFLSPCGFFWKSQLAEEVRALARESRDVIDGLTFVSMIRISAALEQFSFEPRSPDAGVFSADELIKETCALLKNLIPRVIQSKEEQERKVRQLDERISLMETGVGTFKAASPDSQHKKNE